MCKNLLTSVDCSPALCKTAYANIVFDDTPVIKLFKSHFAQFRESNDTIVDISIQNDTPLGAAVIGILALVHQNKLHLVGLTVTASDDFRSRRLITPEFNVNLMEFFASRLAKRQNTKDWNKWRENLPNEHEC